MASPHAGCGVTICRRERRPGAGARSPPLLRHHRHPFWRFYEKRRFNDYFTYSAYVEPHMPKNRCTSCTLTHSPMADPAPRRGEGNRLLPQPRPLRISPQGGSTGVSEYHPHLGQVKTIHSTTLTLLVLTTTDNTSFFITSISLPTLYAQYEEINDFRKNSKKGVDGVATQRPSPSGLAVWPLLLERLDALQRGKAHPTHDLLEV
jgi:hypothetical protein